MIGMKGLLGGLDDSMGFSSKVRLGTLALAVGLAAKAANDLFGGGPIYSVSNSVALLLTSSVVAIVAATTALGDHRRRWKHLRRHRPSEF